MYVYVYTYTHLYINKKLATLRLHLWFVHAGKYTMDNHWFPSLFRILIAKQMTSIVFLVCGSAVQRIELIRIVTYQLLTKLWLLWFLAPLRLYYTPCCRRHNLVRIPYHFKDCYVLYSGMFTAKLSPRHRCAKHAAPLDSQSIYIYIIISIHICAYMYNMYTLYK